MPKPNQLRDFKSRTLNLNLMIIMNQINLFNLMILISCMFRRVPLILLILYYNSHESHDSHAFHDSPEPHDARKSHDAQESLDAHESHDL